MPQDLRAMARRVTPGMSLALPVDYAGVSMAMTRPLIEHGAGGLHLVCVPTGGLQVDMLIGAGLVATVETSALSLGEAGGAPRFNDAVRQGGIRILDATCPAIHAGLMAAQKGVPFLPIRGLIGSDVLANRPDWRVIDNPFAAGDPVALIPAIRPDVAIFHAPMADREGNVWIGRRRELAAMAYAATETLVTVERIVDRSLLTDEMTAAGTLPALYVGAVAEAPRGAWPYGLWGEYASDTDELMRYAAAARTATGFAEYMAGFMGQEMPA
ncbi:MULTISPECIES: CoA transferase [Paracoccus]|uniref:CoA transferase subunit A n=1 Tax=Paracoccus TaxID=265 RepID=UPI001FB5BEDB|nr:MULTISPECIES: CoA transferase [Paracoccus]MCJ1902324.1 CoA synthetase [Paracoccus versutus]MDF3906958.1 CoA-transferase [Paracoccus sp. AS002]